MVAHSTKLRQVPTVRTTSKEVTVKCKVVWSRQTTIQNDRKGLKIINSRTKQKCQFFFFFFIIIAETIPLHSSLFLLNQCHYLLHYSEQRAFCMIAPFSLLGFGTTIFPMGKSVVLGCSGYHSGLTTLRILGQITRQVPQMQEKV